MEQDREFRNEPTLTWVISLQQRRNEYTFWKKTVSMMNDIGKLDSYM